MWVNRERYEKEQKLLRVINIAFPMTVENAKRLVDGDYPTEKAAIILRNEAELLISKKDDKSSIIKAKELEAYDMAIDALKRSEWIPVSKRLPSYREVVLISTFWGVRVAERDSVKEDGTDDFWYLFLDDATAHQRYVYAWMPLPEPYRKDDEDEDNQTELRDSDTDI